jgi:predicted component of type VI protein secretion system
MNNNVNKETTKMASRTYIIGREGHIRIDDPTVSKRHAEIEIIDGEVYLRDLGSTNGTFLIKNKRLVAFKEGYVQLHQMLVLGNRQYSVKDLLEKGSAYADQSASE